MSDYYILDENKKAIPCEIMEWGSFFSDISNRIVSQTTIDERVKVSTVFLGLDHQYGDGPPLIFETMVFGGALDGECERYTTYEEAAAGHIAMLARVVDSAKETRDE